VLVDVRQATFGYGATAVVGVERLTLSAGRCVGVFGPNGAGKTTLVRGVTGLIAPLSGVVDRRADVRFGYMPQHRAMELHWPMTALDAAAMAVSARRRFGWLGSAVGGVRASMRALGVEALAGRSFARLSGGQQQRVLLAGAMASGPDVLVLDEPTDGLDVHSRKTLLELLRGFTAEGLCTVMISHEVEDLLGVCDEIAWLHAGEEEGRASRVEVIGPGELAGRMVKVRRVV
jgi:ABC-type Mn2+/Zn2+ transport system ATPase subunit